MSEFFFTAAGFIFGALSTLVVEFFRRRWALKDAELAEQRTATREARRRQEERQEASAEELLRLLDEVVARYWAKTVTHPNEEPDISDMRAQLDRAVLSLADDDARREMGRALSVLSHAGLVWAETGDNIAHVVWQVRAAARACLGAMLRGEEIPTSSVLADWVDIIEDWWRDEDQ